MSESTGKSARRASVNYTNKAGTFPIDTAWAPEHNRPVESGSEFGCRT